MMSGLVFPLIARLVAGGQQRKKAIVGKLGRSNFDP
jgi:hypothetical protein